MTIVKKRRFCLESNHVSWQGFVADLRISIDPWIPMKGRKPHVITKSWDFLWNAVHNKNTWRIWIPKGLLCRTFMSSGSGIFYGELPRFAKASNPEAMEHLVANSHRSEKGIQHKIRLKDFLRIKETALHVLWTLCQAYLAWSWQSLNGACYASKPAVKKTGISKSRPKPSVRSSDRLTSRNQILNFKLDAWWIQI